MTRHIPVLMNEALEYLKIGSGSTVVDATLGGGGYTRELLTRVSPGGIIVSIDRDGEAIERFERCGYSERFKQQPRQSQEMVTKRIASGEVKSTESAVLCLKHANFSDLHKVLGECGLLSLNSVDAIVADFGISSDQIDTPERGMSFRDDAPLDMRMNRQENVMNAKDVVNAYQREDLARIFRDLADEPRAWEIAGAIVAYRKTRPIETTQELAEIVAEEKRHGFRSTVTRRQPKAHPATQVFLALRMEVNRELESIQAFLDASLESLKPGGRLALVTFHSTEDRVCKEWINVQKKPCTCPPEFPVCGCGAKPRVRGITKKPIVPSDNEQMKNPRSRSAKLRVVEKV